MALAGDPAIRVVGIFDDLNTTFVGDGERAVECIVGELGKRSIGVSYPREAGGTVVDDEGVGVGVGAGVCEGVGVGVTLDQPKSSSESLNEGEGDSGASTASPSSMLQSEESSLNGRDSGAARSWGASSWAAPSS